MPAHPGRQSLNPWQSWSMNPMLLDQENLTIRGQKPHERIPTASNIAVNNDMIKVAPKGMETAVDMPSNMGLRPWDRVFLTLVARFDRTGDSPRNQTGPLLDS
jgi:hypothetical protein